MGGGMRKQSFWWIITPVVVPCLGTGETWILKIRNVFAAHFIANFDYLGIKKKTKNRETCIAGDGHSGGKAGSVHGSGRHPASPDSAHSARRWN